MKKNAPRLFKTLLTTTSALTILATFSSESVAVSRTSQGNTDISNGVGFLPVGFNNGDILLFGGNHDVDISQNAGPFPSLVDFQNNNGNLNIKNVVNITLSSIFKSTGGINGQIFITDPGTKVLFNGTFDSANPINNIRIDDKTTATFATDINVGGIIQLVGAGEAIFNNGITINATDIRPDIFNEGILTFQGNAQVNSLIGSIGKLTTTNIVGGTVTLAADQYNIGNINLDSAASNLKIFGAGKSVTINTTINNSSGNNGSGNLLIAEDVVYFGPIGSKAARLNSITFEADKLMDYSPFAGTFDVFANSIAPSVGLGTGKGLFLASYIGTKEFDVDFGTSNLKLKYLAFSESDEILPVVDSFATLKQGRKIYANELDLYPFEFTNIVLPRSLLTVEGNTLIDALITTKNASAMGEVDFIANSTILKDIGQPGNGKLLDVSFSSNNKNDVISLSGNIYSAQIHQEKPNLTITKDLIFDGDYLTKESTHSLGLNRLTIQGPNNSVMSGDSVINFQANEAKAGNILVDGGAMNMAGLVPVTNLKGLTLKIVDQTTTIPTVNVDAFGNKFREFTILGSNNGGVITLPVNNDVNFTIVSSTNPFLEWKYSNGKIRQTVTPDILAIINKTAQQQVDDPVSSKNISEIVNSQSDLTNDLIFEIGNGSVQEFVNRLQLVVTEVTESVYASYQDAVQTVSDRISSSSLPGKLRNVFNVAEDTSSVTGLTAGDDDYKHGAWTSYSFGHTAQHKIGNSPGYRTNSHTMTIGADTLLNDDLTIGAALSFAKTFVRHKDSNLGDKSSTYSYMGSLYIMQEFDSDWFAQSVGVIGQTHVTNRELRGSTLRQEFAQAKFKSYSYGFEALTGYNYVTANQLLITPMVGLEYNRISKTQYQEFGTRNQNLKVTKRPDDKLDGVVGIRFTKNYRVNNYDITPEIHGFIRRDFLDHKLKVEAKLFNLDVPLVLKTTELNSIMHNLGISVTSAYKNYDYSIGYDAYFTKRYLSQQGSIKLRVNF